MLAAGGAAVVALLIYALVVAPFYKDLKRQRQEVPQKRALLVWMTDAARQVEELRAGVIGQASSDPGAQLSVIEQTAKEFNLGGSLKRVEPKEEDSVRVWLEDAIFEDVLLWLADLENNYGIAAVSVSAERKNIPGYVDARIVLQGTGA